MSSKLQSDIWNQFVSGDHSSFCILFKRYYKGLYGYGLKLCNDQDLVKDSIQNLFVTLWERRDDLTHISSPNVYLYVSLRRNILQYKKKQVRIKEFYEEIDDIFEIHFEAEELMMQNESREEQKKKLLDALNQLTNKQKEVIYLYFYNGMSYGEIEEILAINCQSVRNLKYRAMLTLRNVLDIDVMRLVISK